jgi:hypothetical protein
MSFFCTVLNFYIIYILINIINIYFVIFTSQISTSWITHVRFDIRVFNAISCPLNSDDPPRLIKIVISDSLCWQAVTALYIIILFSIMHNKRLRIMLQLMSLTHFISFELIITYKLTKGGLVYFNLKIILKYLI